MKMLTLFDVCGKANGVSLRDGVESRRASRLELIAAIASLSSLNMQLLRTLPLRRLSTLLSTLCLSLLFSFSYSRTQIVVLPDTCHDERKQKHHIMQSSPRRDASATGTSGSRGKISPHFTLASLRRRITPLIHRVAPLQCTRSSPSASPLPLPVPPQSSQIFNPFRFQLTIRL